MTTTATRHPEVWRSDPADVAAELPVLIVPGRLAETAEVRYQEFSNLDHEIWVVSETDDFESLDGSAGNDALAADLLAADADPVDTIDLGAWDVHVLSE